MKHLFSSLRVRLVATVFVVTLPALVLLALLEATWIGFAVGLLALVAAWIGGEQFVLRHLRELLELTRRLRSGDLHSRATLTGEPVEVGQLATGFNEMAEALEKQIEQRRAAEKELTHRAQQSTVVAALGQMALASTDLQDLLDHVALFIAQTLDVEFSRVLELTPDGRELLLRAGYGWRVGRVGTAREPATPELQAGYTLQSGEPVVLADGRKDARFRVSDLLREHAVVSGASVAVTLRNGRYGVLCAHSPRPRTFTEDEVHLLLSIAILLTVVIERRNAEAELQKLASFAQHSPSPALELGSDGSLTFFNAAASQLAASLGRKHPSELLPPDCGAIVQTCLATNQSRLQHETQVAGRTLSWTFHPLAGIGVVHGYGEDITDRLNLEAQLRQAQKMESIGQLAAGVAHDFNNLLTVIQGHAGILLSRAELPPKLTESSQAVYAAAERAAGLTRQLLMFSRKSLMQACPLDLRTVVADLAKMLQRLLGETIALQFESPESLPQVAADAGMIEQVLLNLAVNARDAMPSGGCLSITLRSAELDDTQVAAHPQAKPGRFVCLRVADTGCGMDAATMSRIFEPFFTTKEPGKGTGLGLATVYGIVHQHGGWIEVASQVGAGTAFTIYLPALADAAAPASPTKAVTPSTEVRGLGERVLLVEDEPLLLELAVASLEENGYRVVSASDGAAALQAWSQAGGAFDLLVTDLVLPEGVSGLELAGTLRARKPDLKILLTSGYGIDDLGRETSRRLNADFLQKPYAQLALAKAVSECLASSK